MNEDLYSSKEIASIPIDIENTTIGREISSLVNCVSGIDTLQPYGFVSLRVIIKMANVLMFKHDI